MEPASAITSPSNVADRGLRIAQTQLALPSDPGFCLRVSNPRLAQPKDLALAVVIYSGGGDAVVPEPLIADNQPRVHSRCVTVGHDLKVELSTEVAVQVSAPPRNGLSHMETGRSHIAHARPCIVIGSLSTCHSARRIWPHTSRREASTTTSHCNYRSGVISELARDGPCA
jgi:hypothetical protein